MQRAASTLTTQPSTAQRKVVRDLGACAASRLLYLPGCGQTTLRPATSAQNNRHRSEPAVSHYSKALFGVKCRRKIKFFPEMVVSSLFSHCHGPARKIKFFTEPSIQSIRE